MNVVIGGFCPKCDCSRMVEYQLHAFIPVPCPACGTDMHSTYIMSQWTEPEKPPAVEFIEA